MTSLDFLYIALGMSAIILTIFISVLLLYTIFIVRDSSKTVENLKISSEKIKETVLDPLKALSEASAGFSAINSIIESIRSAFNTTEDKETKKSGLFRVRKMEK